VIGKVVDASAIAAILFQEPEAKSVAAQIEGSTLFAPELLLFEIANICVKKIRRYQSLEAEIQAAMLSFNAFDIEVFGMDLHGVVATARAHNLTAYDASYLWLARELGCELVTLDARLKSASANL